MSNEYKEWLADQEWEEQQLLLHYVRLRNKFKMQCGTNCSRDCYDRDKCFDLDCDIALIIEALENKIAKKPNRSERSYRCPNCGSSELLIGELPNYCRNCGQRLEW